MDDVGELLRTWELPELIPTFADQKITLQALSALSQEDLKDLIPLAGPRVLFTRCWRTWKNEFASDSISFSGLDLTNFYQESQNCEDKDLQNINEYIVLPIKEPEKENTSPIKNCNQIQEVESVVESQSGLLENILKQSLETSSLLIYKGGTLDGDGTRNLLASVIARKILDENKNSPIVGPIYFKWAKLIKELFPGERTTTYYIPACTTATGTVLQARGKLVHQVLNKRRRLQQLGCLITKKRNREESPAPGPSSLSPRPLPDSLNSSDLLNENVEDDLLWLKNASEPWNLVETKWKITSKQRMLTLHNQYQTIESYCNSYPALKKPHGYTLLNIDFEEVYEDHVNNLFVHFPVAKIKIMDLLKKRKSKDDFCQELICLANSSKEEDQNLAAFLAIPCLLNTSTIKQKKKKQKSEPGCSWKPSRAETRDAFIKHVRSDAEIGQTIELRVKTLNNKGVPPQPYMMIIGESMREIKSCLVIVNSSVIYQRANIIQAVDTCYKAIWALNAEYGCDSYAIWYFLQRGLYKMTSKFDKGSTTAESLLTDCNF